MDDTPTLPPTPPLLTDAELRVIAERAEAATEAPWAQQDLWIPWLRWAYSQTRDAWPDESRQVDADFEFIANSRSDVPHLLADHARLRAYLRRLVACERGEGDLLELVAEVRAVLEEGKGNDQ